MDNLNNKKVGDTVDLKGMKTTEFFKVKCSVCYYTLYPERIKENYLIQDKPCEAHKIWQLTDMIGSRKMLRIEKWKDGTAWRAGIEWYSEDKYEFICEKPTLLECLECIWEEYFESELNEK